MFFNPDISDSKSSNVRQDLKLLFISVNYLLMKSHWDPSTVRCDACAGSRVAMQEMRGP